MIDSLFGIPSVTYKTYNPIVCFVQITGMTQLVDGNWGVRKHKVLGLLVQ